MRGCVQFKRLVVQGLFVELIDLVGEDLHILMLLFN